MSTETDNEARQLFKPEMIRRHYPLLLIDPYAVNIKDIGPNKGDVRLSFYSAFVLHTARQIIEDGLVDGVMVFDDASFGVNYLSTGDLSLDYLTRNRVHTDGHLRPIIDRDKVIPIKGDKFARTSTQVQAVSEYLKKEGRVGEEVLYLGWEYHRERIQSHAEGYGLNVRYGAVEYLHKYYTPNFDLEKLMKLLPLDQITEMEAGGKLGSNFSRRNIAKRDKKGRIPAIVQALPIIGGPRMLDNRRLSDGTLVFEYKSGKQKLKELELV